MPNVVTSTDARERPRGRAAAPTDARPRVAEALREAWDGARLGFPIYNGEGRALATPRRCPDESFSACIVAALLGDDEPYAQLTAPVLAMLEAELGETPELHFFKEHALLPPDADCTALALSTLLRAGRPVGRLAHRGLDRISAFRAEDGVVATYFRHTGDRAGIVDPVVCVNVLFLAHQLGRAHEFEATAAFVEAHLCTGAYLDGTRYYPSPETFLYFYGRLGSAFPAALRGLRAPLVAAVRARQHTTAWPLDLAQRVWLARQLDFDAPEAPTLRALQREDGSWPADGLFRYGRSGVLFGSSALTTAFAAAALWGPGAELSPGSP